MRKILVFAIFTLLFAVTSQACDKGFSPDVGYSQQIITPQQAVIMPAMIVNCDLSIMPIVENNIFTVPMKMKLPDFTIYAYHNPDYGLKIKYNLNLLVTAKKTYNSDALPTTRHVI